MKRAVFARNPQPWTLEGDALARAERARIEEIKRDNALAAESVRRRCARCGAGQIVRCGDVRTIPGACSACFTPPTREGRRLWSVPDAETLNEMILGLAEPMPQPTQETPR